MDDIENDGLYVTQNTSISSITMISLLLLALLLTYVLGKPVNRWANVGVDSDEDLSERSRSGQPLPSSGPARKTVAQGGGFGSPPLLNTTLAERTPMRAASPSGW